MKNFTFELSKSNVLFIGYVFIVLLFLLNRFTIFNKYDKVAGIYIDWITTDKKTNTDLLLHYFDQDTVMVMEMLHDIHTPYTIAYKENNKLKYRHLSYTLKQDSGNKIRVLINKKDRDDFYIFTFLAFWFPYILITIVFCGIWALIIMVFFEKTESFIYSFRKKKRK